MTKAKMTHVCRACGALHSKWSGRCSACGEWNTLEEQRVAPKSTPVNRHTTSWTGVRQPVRDLHQVDPEEAPRISTGLGEFDRVLGGGLVRGSILLIGGDPGIGKSTLLLQSGALLGAQHRVLYVTGEESTQQISLRARRLGLSHAPVRLGAETDVTQILEMLEAEQPAVAIIDSIQTVYHPELQSAPGTVVQVRECAALLTRHAKATGCSIFLVGHVTKEGAIAGPQVLNHMVDATLVFEGEPGTPYRMLRATKNRFGAVNEIGVFAMGDRGLEEVSNPSSLFLTQHDRPVAGCAILAAMEGNRPFLVEVQALVENSPTPNPKRYASGLDTNRLQMILAILNKHARTEAFDKNVYVKVVGGVRLTEPAADLAALLAVHSSLHGRPLPTGLIAFGEVGLAGELRPVANMAERLREAAKLGFTTAFVPRTKQVPRVEGIEVVQLARVEDAIERLAVRRRAA